MLRVLVADCPVRLLLSVVKIRARPLRETRDDSAAKGEGCEAGFSAKSSPTVASHYSTAQNVRRLRREIISTYVLNHASLSLSLRGCAGPAEKALRLTSGDRRRMVHVEVGAARISDRRREIPYDAVAAQTTSRAVGDARLHSILRLKRILIAST